MNEIEQSAALLAAFDEHKAQQAEYMARYDAALAAEDYAQAKALTDEMIELRLIPRPADHPEKGKD
jgi:hypothetical protein